MKSNRTFHMIEAGLSQLTFGQFDDLTDEAIEFFDKSSKRSDGDVSWDGLVKASDSTKKAYAFGLRVFQRVTRYRKAGGHSADMANRVMTAGVVQEAFAEIIRRFGPATARSTLAACKFCWRWAVLDGTIPVDAPNPFGHVLLPKKKTDGYQPWPVEAIEAMIADEKSMVVSTAVMLAYDTGQRIGDIANLTFGNFETGYPPFDDVTILRLTQQKTKQPIMMRCTDRLAKRIAELREAAANVIINSRVAIDATETEIEQALKIMNVLKAAAGFASESPYDATSIGRACQAHWNRINHGVKWMPLHGLRKSATIRLIDAGATEAEVMAVLGHKTSSMANHYGKLFARDKASMRAMDKVHSTGK